MAASCAALPTANVGQYATSIVNGSCSGFPVSGGRLVNAPLIEFTLLQFAYFCVTTNYNDSMRCFSRISQIGGVKYAYSGMYVYGLTL